MKYSIFFLLLASCFSGPDSILVQREKITHLQKKLELAQIDIKNLRREIDYAKLVLIRKQIDEYERTEVKPSPFFMEEREALYELIQAGHLEAQNELDRILRMITELSDGEEYVY